MPAKINHQSIPGVAKLLLAGDAIPGLQEHFNNPENKRRFKEWQTRRQITFAASPSLSTPKTPHTVRRLQRCLGIRHSALCVLWPKRL